MFTPRQLATLSALCDLVSEVKDRIQRDGGSRVYADAVATYVTKVVDRLAMTANSLVRWIGVG